MAIYGRTKRLKLIKPEFNTDTWHDYEYENLDTLDAVISTVYNSGNFRGIWKNNTLYSVGDVIASSEDADSYTVEVEHTTDAISTFNEYMEANPTYYKSYNGTVLSRMWAIETDSIIQDSEGDDYSSKAYAVSEGLIPEGSAKELRNETQQIMQDTADQAATDIATMTAKVTEATNQANASAQSASAAKQSETNAKASETIAAQSATQAKQSENNALSYRDDAMDHASRADGSAVSASNSANLAQTWATGNIDVRPEGSAKYWAELSEQNSKLNTIRTNCLTSVPQNIKLEFNNGTFTLKAGSKVYDGNGLFKTISSDISLTPSGYVDIPYVLFVKSNGTLLGRALVDCSSGSTNPSTDTWLYFNTTDKKVYQIDNGSVSDTTSFPLCVFNVSGGKASSISQTFNYIGYIGSTIFTLQNLRGMRPNGFNVDGSLNNVEFQTSSVLTLTLSSGYIGYIVINSSLLASWNVNNGRYNPDKNVNEYNGTKSDIAIVGTFSTDSTGRIVSFNPKTIFQALDSNDGALRNLSNITQSGKQTAVGWGVPNYAAGVAKASGSAAPSKGWAVSFGNNATIKITVNGVPVGQGDFFPTAWSGNWNVQIMVDAGDVVAGADWTFFPCKGV